MTTVSCHDHLHSGKNTAVSMNEMLSGPHRLSACFGEEKYPLILPQIEMWSLRYPANSQVSIRNRLVLVWSDVVKYMIWKINTTQSSSRRSKQIPVVIFLLVDLFLADNVWTCARTGPRVYYRRKYTWKCVDLLENCSLKE